MLLCFMQIATAAQELSDRQAAVEASKEAYELDLSARENSLHEQTRKMNLTYEMLELLQRHAQMQAQLQAQLHAHLLPKPWYRNSRFYGALLSVIVAVFVFVPEASSRAKMVFSM